PLRPPARSERLSELHREHRGGTEITEPEPTATAETRIWQKDGGQKNNRSPKNTSPAPSHFSAPHLSALTVGRPRPPRLHLSLSSFSFLILPPNPAQNPSQRKRTIK